jgi:5-keto-L-gluconate epimerase
MKLSIAVSTPDAKFSALALKGSFEENFRLVKASGFDGVELHVKNPKDVDAAAIASMLASNGLDVSAIGTGRAFGEEGLCFSSPDVSVRRAAIGRILDQIDFGARFGALVIIGLILGKNPVTPESERWSVESLGECARHASEKGVILALEPINRYETSFIISVEDCLNFIDRVGENCVRILLDTFHMNIEEASMENSIRRASGRIAHVHVADSNRWHPGAGHIDFRSIVSTLRSVGYEGYLSAEIFPKPDPESAARNTVIALRKILTE